MKNFQGAQGQASRSVRMKNILLISKLQHRNLGRVTGCCIEREEKMIVYEYQESRSLDSFLFGKSGCDYSLIILYGKILSNFTRLGNIKLSR